MQTFDRSRGFRIGALVLALSSFSVASSPALAADEPLAVDAYLGLRVPMRDHVVLNASMWKPHGSTKRLPAIVALSPYISEENAAIGRYFAGNDFVVLIADARGRGSSQGLFDPLNESRDAYDVIEWTASQAWCNGKVATGGPSYLGMVQWEVLKRQPPHLVTMIQIAAVRPGFDFPIRDNIFAPYDMQWAEYTSARTGNEAIMGDQQLWIDYFQELVREHRPFSDLPLIAHNTTTAFSKWLQHPTDDDYWRGMLPSSQDLARVTIPILDITGMYDADQAGSLAYYRELMRHAPEMARVNSYLVIGPWDHDGTHDPTQDIGGVDVGAASLVDVRQLQLDWYNWHLNGGQRPNFLQDHVTYYVTGPDEWRHAPSLAAIPSVTRRFYLHSTGDVSPSDAFHSGELTASAAGGDPSDQYTYDPLDTRFLDFEHQDISGTTNVDQRYAIMLFGNGLVYHTAPLDRPLEIIGTPRFHASISMDVPDTDFIVWLYEILPSGRSIALSSAQMRARYRHDPLRQQLVEPGIIDTYDFDNFTWMARRVEKGSRLRLVLSSPMSIFAERNYNSGGVVADESGKDARTAHVTLRHDGAHPTYLDLPVTP